MAQEGKAGKHEVFIKSLQEEPETMLISEKGKAHVIHHQLLVKRSTTQCIFFLISYVIQKTPTKNRLTFVEDMDNPDATGKRTITAVLRVSIALFNKENKSTYQ